jgi:hypothetical protein
MLDDTITSWEQRIANEFMECPELRLTTAQAARFGDSIRRRSSGFSINSCSVRGSEDSRNRRRLSARNPAPANLRLIGHAISLRKSGGTQRIAVFRAFADTVAHGEDQFIVIDTAPTGQTLLPRHIIAVFGTGRMPRRPSD